MKSVAWLRQVRWTRMLPGVVATLATAIMVVDSGVSPLDVTAYAAGLVWSILIPGVLMVRAVAARPENMAAELSLGFVTGLAYHLVGWALFVALGIGPGLALWPLPLLALFAARRSLRAHLHLRRYDRVLGGPTAWLAVAAGLIPIMVAYLNAFPGLALPPGATSWYPDMYWHLGAAAELQRSVPPQVPQVAGLPFRYHWFSQAHMAAMSLSSGVSLPVIVARLWLLPVMWAATGLCLIVAKRITGQSWPGAFAAWLIFGAAQVRLSTWFALPGYETFVPYSPSQVLGIPVLLYVLYFAISGVRGTPLRGEWVLLGTGLLLCTGAKSSHLPVILCGVGLAAVVHLVTRRWVALRSTLAVLAMTVIAQLLGLFLVSGGSAGTGIQLFALAGWWGPWQIAFGIPPLEHFYDPMLFFSDPELGPVLLFAYLVSFVVASAPLWIAGRAVWRDPAAWLLVGVGFAGWSAMLLVTQDGLSQAYFLRGAIVAWHVLAAWALWSRWQVVTVRLGDRRSLGVAGVGVALAVWGQYLLLHDRGVPAAPEQTVPLVTRWVLVSLAVLAALLLIARLWRPVGAWLAATTIVSAAVFGGEHSGWAISRMMTPGALVFASVVGAVGLALWAYRGTGHPVPVRAPRRIRLSLVVVTVAVIATISAWSWSRYQPAPSGPHAISAQEYRAAAWVQERADPFDIVATNLHTVDKITTEHGDFRSFWVGAFTQRRVLLEGWAYTESAHRRHGVDGLPSRVQPYVDQEVFRLNEAAFYAPSDAVMDDLRARGVRWLFASSEAGTLSPEIGRYATERFRSGTVTVYELR